MHLTPIQVESYAGAKADETPRRFIWKQRTIEVGDVLDRWYQVESKPEWPRADYFRVRGEEGQEYLLKHDLESDEWFLGKSWRCAEGFSHEAWYASWRLDWMCVGRMSQCPTG